MRRHFLTCLLLIPPVLLAMLYLLSCFREDDLCFSRKIPLGDGGATVHEFTFASGSGILAFKYLRGGTIAPPSDPPSNEWKWVDEDSADADLLDPRGYFREEPKHHFWNSAGFLYDNGDGTGLKYNGGAWHHRVWFCPWWFPVVLSVLPVLCRLYRRRRQLRPGLCPTCGYDLRAHKAGERCPECGAVIGSKVAPSSAR